MKIRAEVSFHNGNSYTSGELCGITEKNGYCLLIKSYNKRSIPVAELIINRNEVKSIAILEYGNHKIRRYILSAF
ncbi:hypothetical protein [Marinilabilia salmonicolor]|uniref:hypothetical protein n=1 Tax=Marinilabilia salmonicolor TaxID=989 RepID=UPI000302F317|nr:hypothetical protein [Marinilabilia salmonicolor]